MLKKIIQISIIAIVFGVGAEILPAYTFVKEDPTEFSAAKPRRYGPYATLRRANQVANYARRRGYKAKVIYAGSYIYGTRRYYVDVWR